MKLNTHKFALTGAIFAGGWMALATLAALFHVPGATQFMAWVATYAGYYGYHVTWGGLFIGAVIGFIKGYIGFGLFAWVYNRVH